MGWTLPATITDGMAITAANFNAWVGENIKYLKGIGGQAAVLEGPLMLPAGAALTVGTVLWMLRSSKGANLHVEHGVITATIQDNGGAPNNTALASQTFSQLFAAPPAVILGVMHNQAYTYSVGARTLAVYANAFTSEAWTNKANTVVIVSWIAIGPSLAGL